MLVGKKVLGSIPNAEQEKEQGTVGGRKEEATWFPQRHEKKTARLHGKDSQLSKEVNFTEGDQVAVVLQHDIPVQSPLCRVQAFPLFLRELYGHITESQLPLKGNKHISLRGHLGSLQKDKKKGKTELKRPNHHHSVRL